MTKNNKIFDDVSKLANSALTSALNVKNELYNYIKQQVEILIKKMNFVTREEFNKVKKTVMANKAAIEKLSPVKKTTTTTKKASSKSKSSTSKSKKSSTPSPKKNTDSTKNAK